MRYSPAKVSVLWFASLLFLAGNEWLFQITKPSFLSRSDLGQNVELALFTSLLLGLAALPFLGTAIALGYRFRNKTLTKIIFLAMPAILTATTFLLMLDNFTHTILGFNMGAVTGWWRLGYVLLFLAIVADLLQRFERLVLCPWPKILCRCLRFTAAGGLFFCAILLVMRFQTPLAHPNLPAVTNQGPRPNILILSTDGLRAANMSTYGYARQTTPFIDSLANETLRFKNHFANASHTTGSLMALLSGRFPTQSQVIYRPDIFRGTGAFHHLPGILRSLGYRTMDVSLEYYADPFDLNMRNAFDFANFRAEQNIQFFCRLPATWQLRFACEIYFIEHLAARIKKRFAHLAGWKDLGNPYFTVTHTGSENQLDQQTLEQVKAALKNAIQPFFLHIHLLGTHGPKYGPLMRKFSIGKTQNQEWMVDFYDDAILNFDSYVADLFGNIELQELLDNTLIILTSDHGQKFTPWQSIPLIIRFPRGGYSGEIDLPSQQIDVAPTILNYLQVRVPEWMDGRSLIKQGAIPERTIYSVIPARLSQATNGWRETELYRPPFYSLGTMGVVMDGVWYGLSLSDNSLYYHEIDSDISGPDIGKLDTKPAKRLILHHLDKSNYNITKLKNKSNNNIQKH